MERDIVSKYIFKVYPNKDYCIKLENKIKSISKNNYKEYAYEKIGELDYIIKITPKNDLSKKLNRFLDFLDDPGEVLEPDQLKKYIPWWSSDIFSDFKRKKEYSISQQLFDESALKPCEFPCRNKKCRSDKCYFYTEQTRSADEGATCFVICGRCLSRYKFS